MQTCARTCVAHPVCAEGKDFLQMEQRLGLCRRLMMNCAFIILLTHLSAASVVPVICFPFFPLPFSEKDSFYLFYPVVLVVLLGGGIKGGWDKSNKSRKKKMERRESGVGGGAAAVGGCITRSVPLGKPRSRCMAAVLPRAVFNQSSALMFRP